MNYYKDEDDNVKAFNDLQVKQGLADGYTAITEDEAEELISAELTDEEKLSLYESYYVSVFESELEDRGYNIDGTTVAMYASLSTSTYYDECVALIKWREAMVLVCYDIYNAVASDTQYDDSWADVIPTEDEFLAALPDFSDYYTDEESDE
jgi:hypothetical protein